jgi:hypothetical protein
MGKMGGMRGMKAGNREVRRYQAGLSDFPRIN